MTMLSTRNSYGTILKITAVLLATAPIIYKLFTLFKRPEITLTSPSSPSLFTRTTKSQTDLEFLQTHYSDPDNSTTATAMTDLVNQRSLPLLRELFSSQPIKLLISKIFFKHPKLAIQCMSNSKSREKNTALCKIYLDEVDNALQSLNDAELMLSFANQIAPELGSQLMAPSHGTRTRANTVGC